jgi:hypothetical protein
VAEGFFSVVPLVDLVIGFALLEALVLWLWHQRTGRGVPPGEWALNLLSGLCPMGAVRGALTGAPWFWVAFGLAAAGAVHAADLRRRWV